MLLTLILLDMRMLLLISHERIKQPGLLGRHFVTI